MSTFFLLMTLVCTAVINATTVKVENHPLDHVILLTASQADKIVAPMKQDSVLGQACLLTPKGTETRKGTDQDSDNGGKAVFSLNVTVEDDYTLYADVYWNGGDGNSFWVKVDNLAYEKFGNDGPEKRWIPIKGPVYHLTAGIHALTFREREWGAAVSRIMLSPLPDYVASGVAFGSSVTLGDTLGFQDNRFQTKKARLFVMPSYALTRDSIMSFKAFYADTDRNGLLASSRKEKLTVTGPDHKVLYSGFFRVSDELQLTLLQPTAGKYTLRAGNQTGEWHLLEARFDKLTDGINALKDKEPRSIEESFWLPTLELCLDNILRGYRVRHQSDICQLDLEYVLSEFARAEAIFAALKQGRSASLFKPGIMELAHFSAVDSTLCPYTLYLPKAYFSSKQKMPLLIYLHGTHGTQWEMERMADALKRPLSDLTLPMLSPFGRGNAGYVNAVEEDVLQLISLMTKRFRFDTTRILLSGFSLGGMGTLYLGSRHASTFAGLVPVAGAFPWEWRSDFPWKPSGPILPQEWKGKILLLHGLEDDAVATALMLNVQSALIKARIPYEVKTYPGGHEAPSKLIDFYNNFFLDRE
ncbi:MAG: hypothetical protein A2293_10410 [Elusimicrobia bacterium RIFOXYB2_FULL_49_7]|nr:MAG: hypothetical protein A2293_10410 [Elusimicrobia bacterium RIFOXYB2_FULL_49_7]